MLFALHITGEGWTMEQIEVNIRWRFKTSYSALDV